MTRKLAFLSLAAALLALPLRGENLGELFRKAKDQVKASSWSEAIKSLDALDEASRQPGLESQRTQLEPALAFYRGVCLANLDKPDAAREQFEAYLATTPNASLDRAMYSKKAVAAFEAAQKAVARRGTTPPGLPSLAAAYREFKVTGQAPEDAPGEAWAQGPVRVLLTADEKRDWAALSGALSRSEFVTRFWAARDPRLETPENEFRQEFEKRVAFADKYFAQDETRGALTDRGMVFLLLGPPTYAGRKPLSTGDDASEASGLSSVGRHDAEIAAAVLSSGAAKVTTGQQAAVADTYSGPGTRMPDAAANWRELWHYRKELLPAGIPYQQVDFEFITRKGYGKNVLQRDSSALTTLDAAKKRTRGPAKSS